MMTTPRQQIASLLGEIGSPSSFTARRTAPADDLHLEVRGVGRLRFPVSRTQAQKLCRIARPARYGKGEKTLLDPQVRDTWEVPKSRVKIDKRQWNRTLLPMLEALRSDLGLPEGCRLRAELHSMLVYAPGQFFLRHQDSEKADAMVGTLVVTLPGGFKGGSLVVEHKGETATYRATEKHLSFTAFYADCFHEVKPVKEGYRISLTYNLMLAEGGDATAGSATSEVSTRTLDSLAKKLGEHFTTPLPPLRSWEKGAPSQPPPDRLVYLLDHQYTERGLGWHRLKGDDAARVAALRSAAERADCEVVLALAEIQETWSCYEPGWDEPLYGRHRHWDRDEDDDWALDDEPRAVDDPDAYELEDLVDWSISLDRWIDSSGKAAEPIATTVDDHEVCASTPTVELPPYESEYEGYMGNWGNTMDRWYRRGALLVWPRERAFAVRAEASPVWALEELERRIRAGEISEARQGAASLEPFWNAAAQREERRGFFVKALAVAAGLDQAQLASSLLLPFRVEALTPGRARAWVALIELYGEGWARELLAAWSKRQREWARYDDGDRSAWLAALPRLSKALRKADDRAGKQAGRRLLESSWEGLREAIEEGRDLASPSQRNEVLASLARPLSGWLEGAAAVEATELREEAIAFVTRQGNEALVPCLMRVLRLAAKAAEPSRRAAAGLDAIERHCARSLEAWLAQPARSEGDWSITLPPGCSCELCKTLAAFLADPAEEQLEWPINKERRQHVHRRIDASELPVRHRTRRSGSPYTLVLTKSKALFELEAAERRARQADLDWLRDG